ncbi:MAG TPA: hypothetical protein VFU69_00445, partial [Ktedonobacterales bacterium]|nr:hypothetical protein [Ktedonobacterales bacterium]
MTAAEDDKPIKPKAASPQEAPPIKQPSPSPQETPQIEQPEIKASTELPAALHQEETAAAAPKTTKDAQPPSLPIAAKQNSKNEQPPVPPVLAAPSKTRPLPERQLYERHPSATTPPESFDPAAALTDIGWMPPAEDQVARFLSNVADIAPPPVREREGQRAPGFFLPSVITSGEAERKKAKAEPFWSQVVATPMEQPAPPAYPIRPRRSLRKRLRIGQRWLLLLGGI